MKLQSSAKIARRLHLLDDLLDLALRTTCRFAFCDGPLAPIRHQMTCVRCAAIHRAMQMGLITQGAGKYAQLSAVDGRKV
jgi:hypothetical protein